MLVRVLIIGRGVTRMDADNLIRTRSDTDGRGIVYYYLCKSVLVRVLIIGRGIYYFHHKMGRLISLMRV